MTLAVQPIRVASEEGDGLLVMRDGALIAVLVRLSDMHEDQAGMWYLEAALGHLHDLLCLPVFTTLDIALDHIEGLLASLPS